MQQKCKKSAKVFKIVSMEEKLIWGVKWKRRSGDA